MPEKGAFFSKSVLLHRQSKGASLAEPMVSDKQRELTCYDATCTKDAQGNYKPTLQTPQCKELTNSAL